MKSFVMTLTGTMPVLMHNARLANPLDPATKTLKKLTSKRTKTDADHLDIARAEFVGGLYHDTEMGPYIPGPNVHACLVEGAKKLKFGKKVKEGVLITSLVNPLAYGGPRSVEDLWDDANFRHEASVKVGTARTMRCRPMFNNWKLQCDGIYDEEVLDFEQLKDIADRAGRFVGLGDWRPMYGRFTSVVEEGE
jgi:hypothetical protein